MSSLDRFFESTVGMFFTMFFCLLFMPAMGVIYDFADALGELWAVVKNPKSIVPHKFTFGISYRA